MEIKLERKNKLGELERVTYYDIESEADFKDKKIRACRAYCFYEDQFVIVYADSKGYWTPPGGGVEEGETVSAAVEREVKEETNMRVLEQRYIGLLEVVGPNDTHFYTISACLVEPIAAFVADPDGDITEVKMIDFKDYKKYSDPTMESIVDRLVERAGEAKQKMEYNKHI